MFVGVVFLNFSHPPQPHFTLRAGKFQGIGGEALREMKYYSCSRVGSDADRTFYTFEEAVIAGWADDGGMLWPSSIPRVTSATLLEWQALSYPDLCFTAMRLFISESEVPSPALRRITSTCFSRFGHREIVKVSFPDQKNLPTVLR